MGDTILIVDDSLTVRMDLADAFQAAGFSVLPCADAAAARAALLRAPVGLIVLDVVLPDADGVELLREIRAMPSMALVPVLMLSSEAEVRDRIRGLKTGAAEYVGKPYDTAYVVARARELLGTKSGAPGKVTVLVIDDSTTFREELRHALEIAGYRVLDAPSGEDGLRLAASSRPSAIVVDGVMPGIDGATVIRRLRLDAALRDTPCVLLTASERDGGGGELRALDAGADAFVRKEENLDVILARLAAVLRSAAAAGQGMTASLLGPKKILAVDDSATYLQELADMLRGEGYDVVLARSGEEALQMLAVQLVDCILLDLIMPGIGGRETCRRIKASLSLRDIPLIVITAVEESASMIEALNLGADDFILKSGEFEILMARVRAQMRRKQFEDEHRRAKEEIAEQQAFLRQVIDLDRNLIFAKDREGRFTLVNQAVATAYGTTVEGLIGKTDHDFNRNREELDHFQQDDLEVLNNRREKYVPEEMFTDASGRVRWLQTVKRPLVGSHGRADMILGVATDITERKQAEQLIRGQLEHLRLLDQITRSIGERQDLESIFQVVITSLENSLPIDFGCFCLYDTATRELTVSTAGAKSAALAHELAMDMGAPIDGDANGLSRCVQGQFVYEPDIGQSESPFPQRLARGGLRALVMAPLKSESRVFGVLVAARHEVHGFTDSDCEFLRQLSEHVALATHQAKLYESLVQAYDDLRERQQAAMQEERLRALGQMASGIAHDINNALSPVSLYTESLLESEPNLSERARGYLETIRRSVDDVAQTVARMREFYRQREQQLELAPVDLNQLAQQVIALTKARWSDMAQQRGTVIDPHLELTPDLPKVMGVESEIREALTNLVFNAVDAMPEGGKLMLRTIIGGPDQRRSVVMEVADNGLGMDEDTRRRCLEPFFTTKGEQGTGLGLAMVFGMAQRHSCGIEIDSTPGAGTTMRLMFDIPAGIPADAGQSAVTPVTPKQQLILLVDDDPVLLNSLRDALEIDGHVIIAANGGEAAISEFHASLGRARRFTAVITDLGMPHVDGRKVAAAVKKSSPSTPVIMLTGWGKRLISEGNIPRHVDCLLAKPPKLHDLRAALAQLCRGQDPQETP